MAEWPKNFVQNTAHMVRNSTMTDTILHCSHHMILHRDTWSKQVEVVDGGLVRLMHKTGPQRHYIINH